MGNEQPITVEEARAAITEASTKIGAAVCAALDDLAQLGLSPDGISVRLHRVTRMGDTHAVSVLDGVEVDVRL